MSNNIDALVGELIDAGVLPGFAASIVARAYALGALFGPISFDATAERRREWERDYRKRKRLESKHPPVSGGCQVDTGGHEAPPKVPPITPLNTPLTPKPNGLGADAPSDDFVFFKRGKELFGNNAGGFLAKLKRALNNDLPRCLELLDTAALAENPREFAGRVIAGSPQTLKERSKTEWRNMLDELKLATDGFGNGGQSGSAPLRLLPPIGGE